MLYLGRRVYYGVVIVLVMAMSQGLTPRRVTRLRAAIGVSRQMLSRWREWWRERFVESGFWQEMRSRFLPPVNERALPGSLLARWSGGLREQVTSVMPRASEREVDMLELLLTALREHGKPDALYLDNGATYTGAAL
ncbi:MAG: hypothetical protein KC636_09375, partial [Myxococcales bacterium]|nr:hypothetical protein [Myxococcales bacterium]